MTGELNPPPHNGRFTAFRYRDFRLFWLSLFISNTGAWMQMTIFGLDNAILTIFASDILRVGADGFGLLQSARGLGAVIGSFLYITAGQRPFQGKILLGSALLYGAGFALFGLAPSFTLALVLLTFVGAVDTIWASARSTILQWLAHD
jgi:hypothetical protein